MRKPKNRVMAADVTPTDEVVQSPVIEPKTPKAKKPSTKKPSDRAKKPATKVKAKKPAKSAKPVKAKNGKAPAKPERKRADGPRGMVLEILKLALRKDGVSPAELNELTSWKGAPWKWLFSNRQSTGYCDRWGYSFEVTKDDHGETRYKTAKL